MNDDSLLPSRRIVVLGVGNLLWADEGFGVRCVEALGHGWDLPPDVEIMDGGTLGLALVPLLLDATHVLMFDAVAHRGEPGTLIVARDDELPALMGGNKMSLHQVGVNDILASLDLLGHKPEHFTVVGVRPVELADYGGSLTGAVQRRLPEALELSQDRYESGRPSAEVACRVGDERFLRMRGAPSGDDSPREGGKE